MMRKQLSAYSEKNFKPSWTKLSGQTAKLIKDEIFIALTKESSGAVRNQICDLIGELGGTIINIEEEDADKLPEESTSWPELMKRIQELWLSNIDTMMEAALRIMATLFTYVSDEFMQYKSDLYTMFKNGMEHNTIEIKAAAIEALSSWLGIIDSKTCKLYEDLIPLLMNTVLVVLAKNEDKVHCF